MKKRIFWLGLLISALFLYLALSKIDFAKLPQVFKGLDLLYIFLALAISFLGWIVRSMRWYVLISPQKKVPLISLFSATCVGLAANNIFPFRGGDLAQAYFLGHREKISKSLVFSTVLMERLIDLFLLFLLFVFASFFFVMPVQVKGLSLAIILAGVVGSVLVLVHFNEKIERLGGRILSIFSKGLAEKFSNLFRNFITGFQVFRHRRLVIQIGVSSLLLWLIYITTTYILFFSFHLNLTFIAAIFFLAVTAVSVMIPSSPGYIGTWEFFGTTALGLLSVGKELALGFTLMHHAFSFIPITLLGLVFFVKEKVSLREIKTEIAS